jgi:recombination DNA repair RAD52 pathway protein
MSNPGLDVFNVAIETKTNEMHVQAIVEAALDPKLIKTRTVGNTSLDYIGGHTVIRLLNKAFGYAWSFEIVQDEIVPSLPKVNKYKPNDPPEAQPPVVKVLGRLTVPGYGVKEQFGSKVLVGGASEQESTFKSASTDALKKCATLFGIGLELYDDEEVSTAQVSTTPAPAKAPYAKQPYNKVASTTPASTVKYEPADINKIKELKDVLGITDNTQLDPYAREFLDNQEVTFKEITPTNIKAFNVFLSKKAVSA